MGLFRQEALEAQRNRLHGKVVLLPRWPHTLVCGFLLLWVAGTAAFLTQASYSRKATVQGWLEPADGLVQVFPQSEGKLAQVLVTQGESVSAGQPLAVINGDRVLPGGEHLESLLLDEYRRQKAALERQLSRADVLATLRRRELAAALQDSEATLNAIDNQISTLSRRALLVQKQIVRHRQLAASGYITASELDAQEERALLLSTEQQALHTSRLTQVSRHNTLQAELSRLPEEVQNEIDQLRLSLSNLSQEIARLRGNRAYVLQAPVAGTVSRISLRRGQRAAPEQPLVTLLPEGSPLTAQLLIPVRAAGFLALGQPLLMRFDAFPYQKYGLYEGSLDSVSQSAVMPRDQGNLPIALREPVFRARALPAHTAVIAHGQVFDLKPGMTLSADIVLERRSLLEWLLEPIYSLRGRLV